MSHKGVSGLGQITHRIHVVLAINKSGTDNDYFNNLSYRSGAIESWVWVRRKALRFSALRADAAMQLFAA
jgi:hypothetical protein